MKMLVGKNIKFGKPMVIAKVLFHYTYVLYLETIYQIQTAKFATVFCYMITMLVTQTINQYVLQYAYHTG